MVKRLLKKLFSENRDESLYFSGLSAMLCFLSFLVFKLQQVGFILSATPDDAGLLNTLLQSLGQIFFQDVGFTLIFFCMVFLALMGLHGRKSARRLFKIFVVFLTALMWVYGFLNNLFFKYLREQFTYGYAQYADLDGQILPHVYEELTGLLSVFNYVFAIILAAVLYHVYSRRIGLRFVSRKLVPFLFGVSLFFMLFHYVSSTDSRPGSRRVFIELEGNYVYSLLYSAYLELRWWGMGGYYDKDVFYVSPDDWELVSDDYPYLKKYVGGDVVERRFNVVIIIVESMSYMDLSRNYPDFQSTPFLDKLSRKSLFFERFYAVAPTSAKSLTSMLCSIYPYPGSKLITRRSVPLQCMTEILKERNYSTAIFHAGYFQHHEIIKFLRKRSFDTIFRASDIPPEKAAGFNKNNWGYEDHIMLPYIKSWVNETEKPFLLVYFTVSGHRPYSLVPNEYKKNIDSDVFRLDDHLDTIRYSDAFIEDLYSWLRENNLDEDTLFVVLGDHGENFDRSYRRYRCLYDSCIHVACIMHNPVLFRQEKVVYEPASDVDFAPTILDLLGIRTWNHDQGVSMLNSTAGRPVFMASTGGEFGLIQDDFQLIYNVGWDTVELYNLTADPFQTEDIAEEFPDISNGFKEELLNWVDHQSYLVLNNGFMPADRQELNQLVGE
jgi:arylsulfatase A-like enzyme